MSAASLQQAVGRLICPPTLTPVDMHGLDPRSAMSERDSRLFLGPPTVHMSALRHCFDSINLACPL